MLEECGQAMSELYEGKRKPRSAEEKTFVTQIALIKKQIEDHVDQIDVSVVEDFKTRCWAKYLRVMAPTRVHHLGLQSGTQEEGSSESSED